MDIETLKVFDGINKNLDNKKWDCLFPDCRGSAINSHLLQRNGVLDNISEHQHVIQLKGTSHLKFRKHKPISFQKIGVKQAMSYPLFCAKHDTDIFKNIETKEPDLTTYNSQSLFSYRGLCAEYHKKMRGIEFNKRVLKAKSIRIDNHYFERESHFLEAGLDDLDFFKKAFEDEIIGTQANNFVFQTFKFPLIKLCASAVFSPLENDEIMNTYLKGQHLKNVMINIIPQKDLLYIINGYHKNNNNEYIIEYVKSWEGIDESQLRAKLNDLISTKIETWAIAKSVLDNVPIIQQEEFIKYQIANADNLSPQQKTNFSFF